jgi:hypothetical protein
MKEKGASMKKNLMLSLALVFVSLPCFAGSDKGPGPVHLFNDAPAAFSISEPYVPRTVPDETMVMRPDLGTMIMGGVLGNILGSLGGIYLGAGIMQDEHNFLPLLLSWSAGSALGSAAGVSLAGSSQNWRGNPGMAYIGGVLGIGLSWLIVSSPTFQVNAGLLSLVPLVILPPVVSAIFYRSSMRPRRLPAGNALLNFSDGTFGVGVPAIQFRPVPGSGKRDKAGFGFRVNVFNVQL